jgi:hypothetical protein
VTLNVSFTIERGSAKGRIRWRHMSRSDIAW